MLWKYIGDGSFVAGVPARDLSGPEDEAAVKRYEEREGVPLEKTGLYERIDGKKSGPKAPANDEV